MGSAGRQVAIDTETTGLELTEGHRVVEIGCVEIVDRRLGRQYQVFLNPERPVSAQALAVHGLSDDFLSRQPRFTEIREAFLAFIAGAELIAHNAAFDIAFLDAELERAGDAQRLSEHAAKVIDSLALARQRHPGQGNRLDDLCRRYHIDLSARERHGALIDAQLLACVYLAMSGGQLRLGSLDPSVADASQGDTVCRDTPVLAANDAELEQHRQFLSKLRERSGCCLWPEETAGDERAQSGGGKRAAGS